MKNIRMIVTDLDGTLLRNDKTISDYTRSVLLKCREKAIKVVFATGRPERATRYLNLTDAVSCVIADNGANISSGGKVIYTVPLQERVRDGLIAQFANEPAITEIFVEAGERQYTNAVKFLNDGIFTDWLPVFHDFREPVNETVCKITVACDDPEIVRKIVSNFENIRYYPNTGENYFQITHISTSKFNAVKYIADHIGINIDETAAFGDDYNDVEMLTGCGTGVAPENAANEAKRSAAYICASNEDDGVAKFIEECIL